VTPGAEQVAHLLLGDHVAGAQPFEPGHAAANPHARRFTLRAVVRRQARVAALRHILGRDLPGQVVVPAPGGQLVDGHRHTYRKRGRSPRGSLIEHALLVQGSYSNWGVSRWGTRLLSRHVWRRRFRRRCGHREQALTAGHRVSFRRRCRGRDLGWAAGGELLIPAIVLLFAVDIKIAGSLSLVVSLPTMLLTDASVEDVGVMVGEDVVGV
jgi:hypothetical protein